MRVRPHLGRSWVYVFFRIHGVLLSCLLPPGALVYGRASLRTVHTVGGTELLQSVGWVYCLSAVHGRPVLLLGHDICPAFCSWLPRHLNLMLGNSRVGSLTRDLWRWRAPQVLRLWDCLAGVQCETSPRPLWGNDGGWSRGTHAKLHCLTCDVPR